MYKSYSMELAGRTLTVDIGRVAKQANGAALMHYGDTTVLATATASKEPREGIDFFPLSVEYEEKMYAVGKIPCYRQTYASSVPEGLQKRCNTGRHGYVCRSGVQPGDPGYAWFFPCYLYF